MEDATAEEIENAHRALSLDPTFQQTLPGPLPQQEPPQRIEWLEDFFRFIDQLLAPLGPLLTWLLYIGAALLLLYVVFNIVRAFYDRREQMRALLRRDQKDDSLQTVDMRPDEVFATNLLEQADALAREGKFGEAIRLLLHSSIHDMQQRIHKRIGVSLTAREIGVLGKMPDESRAALHRIIHLVEINVFALQNVGEADYQSARQDYTVFAFREKA